MHVMMDGSKINGTNLYGYVDGNVGKRSTSAFDHINSSFA